MYTKFLDFYSNAPTKYGQPTGVQNLQMENGSTVLELVKYRYEHGGKLFGAMDNEFLRYYKEK